MVNIISIQYKKNKVILETDNEVLHVVNAEAVARYSISVGEITANKFREFLQFSDKLNAKENLFGLIARGSSKSKYEYKQHLMSKKFNEYSADYALEVAESYGYIDDLAFAKRFINQKKDEFGTFKIIYDLRQKKIDVNVIDEALLSVDIDELKACENVARKYLKNKELDFKTKQRLYRYLQSRGFSFDTIECALDKIKPEI